MVSVCVCVGGGGGLVQHCAEVGQCASMSVQLVYGVKNMIKKEIR